MRCGEEAHQLAGVPGVEHHCQQCPFKEALGLPASGSVGERQRSKQVHRLRGEASHRSLFDVNTIGSSAEALSTRSMKPAWEGSGADQLVRDAGGKGGQVCVCVERGVATRARRGGEESARAHTSIS